MEKLFFVFLALLGFLLFYFLLQRRFLLSKQKRRINTYVFPKSIKSKLVEKYSNLSEQQVGLIIYGLREYFHLCHSAGNKMVSMPSQAVDSAWHEFILFTKKYETFCDKAFGRFLHHVPAEAMTSPTIAQKGIKTAWKICCTRENIQPKSSHRLPLLFALDALLDVSDGFKYSLNCLENENNHFCAAHIGCSSGVGVDAREDVVVGLPGVVVVAEEAAVVVNRGETPPFWLYNQAYNYD